MLQSFGRSFKPITPRSLSVLSITFVIVVVSVPVQGILPVFSWRSTLHDYASFYFEAARYKTRPVMIKRQVLFRMQSTPALRTPRSITPPCYYGQQQNPRQKLQTFDWNKLPLLRTLATTDLRTLHSVPTSQYYCFLSRYSGHRAASWNICTLFETVFVFFGRFPLLLSINQNSLQSRCYEWVRQVCDNSNGWQAKHDSCWSR